jgi:hypothetical protein
MPTWIHIYGVSDHVIQVTGEFDQQIDLTDIPGDEGDPVILEVTSIADDDYPVISHLTVIPPIDSNGQWRIFEPKPRSGLVKITLAPGEPDTPDEYGCPYYSDRADVRGATTVVLVQDA